MYLQGWINQGVKRQILPWSVYGYSGIPPWNFDCHGQISIRNG